MSLRRLDLDLYDYHFNFFGALPLALAYGPGAEAREQIGWIVVGGMAFGTFLTLFVLPIVYIWINSCVTLLSTQKQPD